MKRILRSVSACFSLILLFATGQAAAEQAHITIEVSVSRDMILQAASIALKDKDANTITPIYCNSRGSWKRTVCEATTEISPGLYRIEGEVNTYRERPGGGFGGYSEARYRGTVAFSSHRPDISFGGRIRGTNATHCGRDRCPLIKSFYVKSSRAR